MNIPDFVEELVQEGIEVTLMKDYDDNSIVMNLNSGAKSHMHLAEKDGQYYVKMRYNQKSEWVESVKDLCWIFLECYRMRDFGNCAWLDLCVKHDILEKKVEVIEKVSYR